MRLFSAETAMGLALIAPFLCAALLPFFRNSPNVREGVTLTTAGSLACLLILLLTQVLAGARPELHLFQVTPALELAFALEPLGMLFALVAGLLWLVNSIYSIGYMRAHDEPRQTIFYVCFAIALGSALGIAFAKNLFTFFIFYEALTLSTYPLVTHNRNKETMRAGRLYLLLLMGTSMVLLLPAIIATWALAGTLDFTAGGILAGKLDPFLMGGLLALYVFGIGKAAMMPVHFWLPAAMVAPTPVSAFLHAVAVVKAGVFGVLKVLIYVCRIEALQASGANEWLIFAASASMLIAAYVALRQDNLKARLAYSTVSQLAYVVLGGALAVSAGVMGGGLQIIMHAAAKITLFFCAGALYIAAHKSRVSELDGVARAMPVTMTAFLIGSLSIIGLPPFGGVWSKWMLLLAALDTGHWVVAGALMASALLAAGYLLPIAARAFFLPPADGGASGIREAPLPCLIALCASAALCVFLFFWPEPFERLLEAVLSP